MKFTIYLVMILAVVLRFMLLGRQSFWFDEAYTYTLIAQDVAHALGAESNNPPLYYLGLYYWVQIFGYGEAGIRSFSALSSCISLLLFWQVAKHYVEPSKATAALLLAAISPFHIYYAQEARCFAFLNCLILAMTLAAIAAARKSRWQDYILFAFWSICSLYTHYIAVFYIAALGLFLFFNAVRQKRDFFKLLLTGVSIPLAFFPWLLVMLQAAGGGGQVRRYLLLKLPQTYASFLFSDVVVPLDSSVMSNLLETLKLFYVEFAFVLMVGLGLLWQTLILVSSKSFWQTRLPFVFWMAVCPLLLAFLVSFKVMLFDERYVQASSFFVYILLVAAFPRIFPEELGNASQNGKPVPSAVARVGRNGKWTIFILVAFFIIQLLGLYNYFAGEYFKKDDWRSTVALVEREAKEDALLIFDVGYADIPFGYYATRPFRGIRALQNYVDPLPKTFEWTKKLEHEDAVVLIRSHFENDRVLTVLESEYVSRLTKRFPYGRGIDVYFLEK